MVVDGSNYDAETRTDSDDYRYKEKQSDIVGNGAKDATLTLHLPYIVESKLNVGDKHEHGEEHEQQSDA